MAPRPTIPASFSELIYIATPRTTHPIIPTTPVPTLTTPTSSPLKTPIHPWDACASTITILAPSPSLDFVTSITPTPQLFNCPATVTWTADTALFTGSLDTFTPADTDSVAGDGTEDGGFDIRDIPKWQVALVAFGIVDAAILVILVVVGIRGWRDRKAKKKRGKGKGRELGNGIEMGRFEGQVDGTTDAGSDVCGAKGAKGDEGVKRGDACEKQYLHGGQTLEEKDVSDYVEGMQGRF